MTNKLQQYFPMLQTRESIMEQIESSNYLQSMYDQWTVKQQQEFLDFCTGVKGVKPMYDFISKEILNPETVPERIDELLSLLLKQEVHIVEVLPNDNTRLADESSLVIMDIVVQLKDGSIANLEIQKIGYKFPGERSACYSADLLLRQYKRVRSRRREKFVYKDIRQVYTIVLFEQSPHAFQRFSDKYLHYFEQKSDTGLEIDLLQKYLFIPLDIFRKIQHNKNVKIENRLEAWLTFLCMDEPDAIVSIIEKYPDFKVMYEQIYDICRNIEEVMSMFSKELRELDRNTVQLMIDEMQEELNRKTQSLQKINQQLNQKVNELSRKDQELGQKDRELDQKDWKLDQKDRELDQKDQKLGQKDQELNQKDQELNQKDQELDQTRQAYQKALERIAELEGVQTKTN